MIWQTNDAVITIYDQYEAVASPGQRPDLRACTGNTYRYGEVIESPFIKVITASSTEIISMNT